MIALVALALAAPRCAPPAIPPTPVQVSVQFGGYSLAGMGIASLDEGSWALTMLSFGGVEMFTVSDQGVQTGLEAWRPWLSLLPVERDLRLVFTPAVQGRCRTGDGVLRTRGLQGAWRRRWWGPGGTAVAERQAGVVTVEDRRRGYVLRMVVTDAGG